ncbi:MAG: rane protein [Bacteroidetes bacterium]|nr:rane protein [Bacteroidota bacterium]
MYAFRKPFSAATYHVGDVDFKVILVISQGLGYMISKFTGIKIISEMKEHGRGKGILILTGIAAVSLFFFAITPYPYSAVFMFINGLPLGMIWGLVFAYVEGRRSTEFIGSMMCVSFIFSSGFVKQVGDNLMKNYHVNEYWMPFATGMIFFLPMVFFVFLLEQLPPPDADDIANRTVRKPMTAEDRKTLLGKFLPGLVALVITYALLSIVRDLRDLFIANIWKENGFENVKDVFTSTENIISVIVLFAIGLMIVIKNNFTAFIVNHFMVAVGFIFAGVSSFLYAHYGTDYMASHPHLSFYHSPVFFWMLFAGLGLYLAYVPFNALFFERLIAAFKYTANVGFLIYIADSFGYLGSISVLLFKTFGMKQQMQWSPFMASLITGASAIGLAGIILSFFYFNWKYKSDKIEELPTPVE